MGGMMLNRSTRGLGSRLGGGPLSSPCRPATTRCGVLGILGTARSSCSAVTLSRPAIERRVDTAERKKADGMLARRAGVCQPGIQGMGLFWARWFSVSRERLEGKKSLDEKQKPASALRKVLPSLARQHENIYTLPNLLTASRLVAAPFVGYCILHDYHAWALGLFAYAGITDLLDGWIARRWNLGTVVGTVIDPMADKTLMTILTVTLAIKGALPVWLAVIILGRDVGLAISAIYYRWVSLPPPKTFTRYWDFSLPSAEVRPTLISKYNTALQLALMGLTTVAPVVPAVDLAMPLGILQYVVAATTVWSGASYVFSKDAVKILSQPQSSSEPPQTQVGEEGDENTPKSK